MRHGWVIAAGFAAVFAGLQSAPAEETCLRIPLDAADIPPPYTDWFGIYIDGKKSGYMREEFGRTGTLPDAACFVEQSGRFQLVARGKKVEIEIIERKEFDGAPPFAFRGGRSSMKQAGGGTEIVVSRAGAGLAVEISERGEKRTMAVASVDFTLADLLTPERWIQKLPAAGAVAVVRGFGIEHLRMETATVTLLARRESVVSGVKTAWFEVKAVIQPDGNVHVMRLDERGRTLSLELGKLIEARRESEETAKKLEVGSDLFVLGMAKVDAPLGDPRKVTRMVLTVDGAGAASLANACGQSVARSGADGSESVTVTVGTEVDVEAKVTDQEAADALRETVEYPIGLPQVKALAEQAVGDAKTPREKVERLVHFVDTYVVDADVPGLMSVAEIISSKRGDCTEHARLFAALARAAGVPARELSGLMYMGDDVKAFGGHQWNEVVLDGRWVPVDATWNEVVIDAAHVTLERGGGKAALISTMGRLRFHLVDVKRAK